MISIQGTDLVACICEGPSEKLLIDLLLTNEQLIFDRSQLLDDKILTGTYRGAAKFQNTYLTMDYGAQKLVVVKVEDKKSNFTFSAAYAKKIQETYYVITAPEIEMLMIHSLNLYTQYQKVKSNKKPSVFLAEHLKKPTNKIKSQDFIRDFYDRYDLIEAIKIHKQKAPRERNCHFIADLLK